MLALWALLAGNCFAAAALPEQLEAYGVVKSDGKTLTPSGNSMVYGLASPLFTDYALKFRTITLPVGAHIGYRAEGVLEFPVGTIISKTFYYERDPQSSGNWVKSSITAAGESIDLRKYQMVETRVLQREADGSWIANTYIWNEEQTNATLRRIGLTVNKALRDPQSGQKAELAYGVPNARQCQSCHAVNATVGQAGIQPIGPTARFLNMEYGYADGHQNQLARLGQLGTLDQFPDPTSIARNVAYADPASGSLEARARAYAEVNCAHCHHNQGDARQSGLFLTTAAAGSHLGVCKQHVAAGSGGANLTYDIVPGHPDQSLLISRMEATTGQAMMPRLGRSLVDKDGIGLIRAWIAAMPGNCEVTH